MSMSKEEHRRKTLYYWGHWLWHRISTILKILAVAIVLLLNWLFAILLVIALGLWGYRGQVKSFFAWLIRTVIINHIGDFRFGRKHRKYTEKKNKKKLHWEESE
jgi:hypothetical protein